MKNDTARAPDLGDIRVYPRRRRSPRVFRQVEIAESDAAILRAWCRKHDIPLKLFPLLAGVYHAGLLSVASAHHPLHRLGVWQNVRDGAEAQLQELQDNFARMVWAWGEEEKRRLLGAEEKEHTDGSEGGRGSREAGEGA